MFILNAEILTKVAPSIKGQRAINISRYLNEVCPLYGIDSADAVHEFIANLLHECADFTRLKENLNYSSEGLCRTWPSRFPTLAQALPFAHNQQKIADRVYSGRMGNTHPGDAWKFIGSGPAQLTGREMITLFTIYYNKKFNTSFKAEAMAEALRTDVKLGIHSACWFFAIAKNLIPLSLSDNMRELVRRWNGGYIGMKERLEILERAKTFIT